ncbi:MAG TPA: hypothetical protein VKT33_05875 [Candidatus Angelobacter sp.]|nr:hypothetical protein [Candidatus Angelobacter sp.]
MMRFTSITTIAAMICSLVAPVVPGSCLDAGKSPSCHHAMAEHRGGSHKYACHEHQAQEGDPATAPPSSPSIQKTASQQECPMSCCCCAPASAGGKFMLASDAGFVVAIASSGLVATRNVVLERSGFSSHTDRGPPFITH